MPPSALRPIRSPFHVAVIMDGNGRWASGQGMERVEGHRRGAEAVRRTVRVAPALGITTLTLFAFSADNWKRPSAEVRTLLTLFAEYLRSERRELVENRIRLSVIGRRDRLPGMLIAAIARGEAATAAGSRLHLRIAIDYSAREAIVRAAGTLATAPSGSRFDAFRKGLAAGVPADESPDVDLLIRTGGERRLSDFLLWESAYAELVFLQRMWPEFGEEDLAAAVADFHGRQRRFGGLPAAATAASERA